MKIKLGIMILAIFLFSCDDNTSSDENRNIVPSDNEQYSQKVISNMHQASEWIIEEGIKIYATKGREELHRNLVDTWGVLLWMEPWVYSDEDMTEFRIKARGINYQVLNLFESKISNSNYEFWIVKIVAEPWSGEKTRSTFYLTKSEDKFGLKEIIKHSDQFIDGYSVDGIDINFPIDDMKLLYMMEAWQFPDNYRNSELKDIEVYMDARGKLKVK